MSTKTENTADREIVVSRIFDAPRELVWEAMTKPEHIAHWWGPRGFTTETESMDFRVGGSWKHTMRGPDGTEYPNHSVYKEIVAPERIVMEHGGGRKGGDPVCMEKLLTLEDLGDNKTKVTFHIFTESKEMRDRLVNEFGALEGGKQNLEKLGEFLSKRPIVMERTFDAPVDMVWKALTDPYQMKQWYFDNLIDFKPEVGFETQVDVSHNGMVYEHLWKVTAAEPGKKIAYSWKYKGHKGDSLVTFELFPEGQKTRLKLTHEGLDSFGGDENPAYARGSFFKGWTMLTGKFLPEFLEQFAPFADRDFFITRVFDAPREVVWEAWTDPKKLAQWWGPKDFTNPVCELDMKVGGAYRIVMRAPDGSEYPLTGVIKEIVKPEKLVMTIDCSAHDETWHDMVNPDRDKSKKPHMEMVQTATFEDADGGKTRVSIRSRMESAVILKGMLKTGMNEGWSMSLDRLAACVDKK